MKYCGAKKKDGTKCRNQAGLGTSHLGTGTCKFHGGNLSQQLKLAAKREAKLLGSPIELNPLEAIIWCIRITAGEVKWYSDKIEELEQEDWIEQTLVGKQLHLFARERQSAQDRLVRYSQIAISLGLAERAIRMAEMYGDAIARLLDGVLKDLQLSPVQKKMAPGVVRKHLMLLQGGRVQTSPEGLDEIIEGSAKEITSRGK
jgi:hypothetical protein